MLIDLIFFIGEIFLISSYLCRNILFLRIGATLGMGSYSIGALVAGLPEKGMKAIFIFGILTVLINIYEIFRIIRNLKPVELSTELNLMYNKYFNNLTKNEFLKIYNLQETKFFKNGENLSIENQIVNYIYFIELVKSKVTC